MYGISPESFHSVSPEGRLVIAKGIIHREAVRFYDIENVYYLLETVGGRVNSRELADEYVSTLLEAGKVVLANSPKHFHITSLVRARDELVLASILTEKYELDQKYSKDIESLFESLEDKRIELVESKLES